MNKLEARYAAHLDLLKAAGEIIDYGYEPIKLRLADRTYYTPDFLVQCKDLTLEAHEVKGFWEDDARVKWKVAGEQHRWLIMVAITADGKNWKEERQ